MAFGLHLKVTAPDGKCFVPLGEEPVTVGRHPGNVLKLSDERASRYHCVVERRGAEIRITDLGSRNGTRVNGGEAVTSAPIKVGDIIRIGNTQIELVEGIRQQTPAKVRLPQDIPPSDLSAAAQRADELLHALDAELEPAPDTQGVLWNQSAGAAPPVEPGPGLEAEPLPNLDGPPKFAPPTFASAAPAKPPASAVPPPPITPTPPPPATGATPMAPTFTAAPEAAAAAPPMGEAVPEAHLSAGIAFESGDDSTQPAAFRRGRDLTNSADKGDPRDNPLGIVVTHELGTVADQERRLRVILNQLEDQTLSEKDLVLVNARGQKMKMPQTTEPGAHQGAEAVVLLRLFLLLCARTGASDVHVEPKRDHAYVRVRIDGMMVETVRLAPEIAAKIVGVVKILADLDISQKAAVQDSHFSSEHAGRRVDYRVSFAPSMFGQSLVIRVLDMKFVPNVIKDLGMPHWMSQNIYQVVQQDQGMLIVCGPTGSGKTTSLYAVIRDIDVAHRNVITIEDPPEFNIDGVTQMACNESQGNTFATLLRSVLRQDPDVVLVGEIRDAETARIALQAAMTGHLVLTTVHAKDGIGSIFRLLDLGVEPFLVASSMNLVLSQRLVRRLCDHCKVPAKPKVEQISRLGRYAESLSTIYYPGGCARCLNTGYVGRQGLYELLTASEELRDVVLKTPGMQQLRRAVQNTVFSSLRDSGFHLVAQGVTSLDEIDRVLGISTE